MSTDPARLSPYIGPRPFEQNEQDRARFFGRDQETGIIVSLIFSHPLVLVYARSGVGKTSLFNAKVVPALQQNGFQVLPMARVRSTFTKGVNPQNLYVFNVLLSLSSNVEPQTLTTKSLSEFLKEYPRSTTARGGPVPRAIIFDQFEELFTLYPENWHEQQRLFFHQIEIALAEDPLLRIVFLIREDYTPQLDSYSQFLPEGLRPRFRLEGLRKEAAMLAITEPLTGTGHSFAEDALRDLVDDLLKVRVEREGGTMTQVPGEFVEPVQLQVVCRTLWDSLPPSVRVITVDHLHEFGDVDNALGQFYEGAVQGAVRETRVREEDIRRWFEKDLITPIGTRGTVFRGQDKTGELPNAAVDVLENRHIVRADSRAGSRWYELTHDRFIGPIQRSNHAMQERRRAKQQKRRWILVGVGALLMSMCVVLLGCVALVSFQQRNTADQQRNTANQVKDEIGKASSEMAKGNFEQAIRYYDDAIQLDPKNGTAYTNRAIAKLYVGGYDSAIKDYDQAIALNPRDPTGYMNRAVAYEIGKHYDSAIADYSKAISLDQGNETAFNNRGAAYHAQGKLDSAIVDYTEAIRLDPKFALSYGNIGLAYLQKGNLDEALRYSKRSVDLDANAPINYNVLGAVYYARGDVDNAILDYTKAIELARPRLVLYFGVGPAYVLKANRAPTPTDYADYIQLVDLDPNYALTHNNLAVAYYTQGALDKAIAEYSLAISLFPEFVQAYNNRGVAYYSQRNFGPAIDDYSKAIAFDPGGASAHFNRGLAYRAQNLKAPAIADFENYLKLEPNAPDSALVRRWLGELRNP